MLHAVVLSVVLSQQPCNVRECMDCMIGNSSCCIKCNDGYEENDCQCMFINQL